MLNLMKLRNYLLFIAENCDETVSTKGQEAHNKAYALSINIHLYENNNNTNV